MEIDVKDMLGKSFIDNVKHVHNSGGFVDVPVGKVRKFILTRHKNLNYAHVLHYQ